ncbi:MAG: hypothetical protein M1496_03975 [Candidatus Thermoplasmatota archaeon]|nr:hypothetical protein [Candidatus Thermoplasmatota archaeon]
MNITLLNFIYVIAPVTLSIMSILGVKLTLRDKERLMKNPEYSNVIPSRYETIRYRAIWGISIISIIGYSILEVMNFIPDFTHSNEEYYLYLIIISYSAGLIILSPREKLKIKWKQ